MGIAMPLHWKIAPLEQMVVCVSEGVVTKDELMAYFKAIEAAGAAHYRKMLDASRAECHLTADEIAELAAYAKSLKAQGTPGPMAIFTGSIGKRRVRQEHQRPAAAGPAAAHVLDHPCGAPLAGQRTARALVVAEGAGPRLRPSCRRTSTGSAPTLSPERGSASD